MYRRIIFCLSLFCFIFLTCGKKENANVAVPSNVGNIYIADTILPVDNLWIINRGYDPISGVAHFQLRLHSDGISYTVYPNGEHSFGSGIGNYYWIFLYNRDTSLLESTFYEYQKDYSEQEDFDGRTWNEAASIYQNASRGDVHMNDRVYRTQHLDFEILSVDGKEIEFEFSGVATLRDSVSYPFTGEYKGNYSYHIDYLTN